MRMLALTLPLPETQSARAMRAGGAGLWVACLLASTSLLVTIPLAMPDQSGPAPAVGPVASFETDADNPFRPQGLTATRVAEYATDGQYSLKVEIKGSDEDSWPGLLLPGGDQPNWSKRRVLMMDIFVATADPVHLSTRLDIVGEPDGYFGSVPELRPGRNRSVGIPVGDFRSQADLTRVKSLLIYSGKPRKDIVLYVDNVRWAQYAQQFKRMQYVETLPKPQASLDEARRGFITYSRNYLRSTFAFSRPDSRVTGLRAFVAGGQKEPVTVNVYALRDLKAVSTKPLDLTGPGGATIPAARWDVRLVRYLNKRLNYSSDRYYADIPTYLEKAGAPTAIAADTSARFWMILDTPVGAQPGVYRGTVTVQADGATQAIPLSVRVLPFGLPEPKALMFGPYYQVYGHPADERALIRRDLADMRDHGQTSIGLCLGIARASYTVKGEEVTFDFRGDTRFEWVMDDLKDLGFPADIVLLSDSGQEAAGEKHKMGEPEYDHIYVNFHKALAAAAQAKGWSAIYIQPEDEPSWQDESVRTRNTYLLKLLKTAGIRTEQDGPADNYFTDVAGPYADLWNCNGVICTPEVLKQALGAGHLVTVYNYNEEGYIGEVSRWACGLFNWRNHLSGAFNWEYRGGSGDLYDDLDGQYGDFVLSYPKDADHAGGPSIGWEGMRAGIYDRRYLALLEEMIQRGRDRGGQAETAADRARAMLDDLRARLDDNTQADRRRTAWTATLTPQQAARHLPAGAPTSETYLAGDLKFQNNVAFEEYDSIRWLVTRHIGAIMKALGEKAELGAAPSPASGEPARRLVLESQAKAEGRPGAARPVAQLPRLSAAPNLLADVAADSAWAAAGRVTLARCDTGAKAEVPTEVRCGIYGDRLYVAFICHEDRIGMMTARVTKPDGPVWEDDCVELFLDPGLTGKRFWHVLVNSLGTIARLAPGGKTWDADVIAKANVDAARKQWTVALSLPVGEMRLAPRFGLNFARERRPTEAFELTSWSVTGEGFGVPERFGIGVLSGDVPSAPAIKPELAMGLSPAYLILDDASVELSFDLTLAPQEAQVARLEVTITTGDRQVARATLAGPLDDRVLARLYVGDLPSGDYAVTANLKGVNDAPAPVTAWFKRFAGPF